MPVVGHGADLDGAPLRALFANVRGGTASGRGLILHSPACYGHASRDNVSLRFTYLRMSLFVTCTCYGGKMRTLAARLLCVHTRSRAALVGSRGENPDNARAIVPFTKRHAGGRAKG